MFSRETDMYRSELRVVREERARMEEELSKTHDKLKEALSVQPPSEAAQQSVVQQMQKDFELRMERSRDETQYLRTKCDEKERRIETLLAERASLAGELRSLGGSAAGAWRLAETADAGSADLEAGAGAKKTKAIGGGNPIRT